jgi:SagB-type dehydrogenase family enzyme
MDLKTFEYLYYKTRGYSKEDTLKEAKLTEDEFFMLEQTMAGVLGEIGQELPRAATIGKDFVKLTSYIYSGSSDQEVGMPHPAAIKAPSGAHISLPAVDKAAKPEMTLRQAIEQRKSLRTYSDKPFTQEELSFFLWACCWAKEFKSTEAIELTRRNVPSAGSRHPFEYHLLINRVEGLKPGLYYYHPLKHSLIRRDVPETIAKDILDACLEQEMVETSAFTLIMTAVPYRTVWRYQQRAYRYLYLDAGHVGQNAHLAAEALGAGACMIGAYQDEAMNDCLGVDGVEEFVIYVATVGKKAEK